MKLRTYQAYTMAEALGAVKRDLGADAVILHTRTFKRGGILGVGGRSIVEVTATQQIENQRTPIVEIDTRNSFQQIAAQRAYTSRPHKTESSAERSSGPSEPRVFNRRDFHPPEIKSIETVEPATRRFVLKSPGTDMHPQKRASIVEMEEELSAIRSMVGKVMQRQRVADAGVDMPEQLFEMYLKLIGQEVSEELADQIVAEVREEIDLVDLDDEHAVRQALLKQLTKFIPVTTTLIPEKTSSDRPFTIALVGPTGVGKTTTLAKLAATFKLKHGRRVGLVTADSYRIAAVDQLRTYAEILGLPLHVAMSPSDMQHALRSCEECDVILIDTAGRSQNDATRITELKQILNAAQPHEVHLVISSTAGEKVLLSEAEAFSEVGIHRIVLTKLDEAVNFGVLINVIRKVNRELSFVTTGQEVPNDLEVGDGKRLAELILGDAVKA